MTAEIQHSAEALAAVAAGRRHTHGANPDGWVVCVPCMAAALADTEAEREKLREEGRDECVFALTDLVRAVFPDTTVDDGSGLDDVCDGLREGVKTEREAAAGEAQRLRAAAQEVVDAWDEREEGCLARRARAERDLRAALSSVPLSGGPPAGVTLTAEQAETVRQAVAAPFSALECGERPSDQLRRVRDEALALLRPPAAEDEPRMSAEEIAEAERLGPPDFLLAGPPVGPLTAEQAEQIAAAIHYYAGAAAYEDGTVAFRALRLLAVEEQGGPA